MQQPAIQAALDNLVEVIRTALTAEFLEYFRDGEAKLARGKRTKAGPKRAKAGPKRAKTGPKRAKTGPKRAKAKQVRSARTASALG